MQNVFHCALVHFALVFTRFAACQLFIRLINVFCIFFIESSFYNIYGILIFYWSNGFHHFPNGVILLNTDATKQRVGFDSYDNSINVSMELSIYGI